MPNWKKVIVSGSDAVLGSLKVPSIVSAGSVTTGVNVITIASDGKLHMTGSYGGGGAISTLQAVTDAGNTTTTNITASHISTTATTGFSTFAANVRLKTNSAELSFGDVQAGRLFADSNDDFTIANRVIDKDIIFTTLKPTTVIKEIMRLDGSSLNVGIGTTSPLAKLHVSSAFASGDTNSTVLKVAGSGSVSGSGLFDVDGSTGTLFAVVDDGLDDVIFAANNVSGTPVIEANADNTVKLGKLNGFGIVISGSTPAPSNIALANILMTGSVSISGSMGVGMSATTTFGRIDAKNDVVAFSTSDERLKKYIKNIPNALDKVSQINGVNFQWKKTDEEIKQNVHSFEGKDVGVIAQEIEKVLPEVVTTRDNGYKAVKYEKIIPLLVEAIKELRAEVQELKNSK